MKKIVAKVIISMMIINLFAYSYNEFTNAYASNNQIQKKEEEIDNYRDKLNDTNKDRKKIEAEAAKIDKDIEISHQRVKEIENRTLEIEKSNEALEKDIKISSNKIDENYEIMKDIIKIEYEQKSVGYIALLLESKNFGNFFRRIEVVYALVKNNDKIINETKQIQRELQGKSEILKVQIRELHKKKNEAKVEKDKLQKLEESKKLEIGKLILAQQSLTKEIELSQKELDELEKEREAIDKELSPSIGSGNYEGGSMTWPVPGYTRISSKFGNRIHPISGQRKLHKGIDIPAPAGVPVVAANSGKVIMSKYSNGYGNFIAVDHGGGIVSYYAHNTERLVSVGDNVSKGQKIATIGTTGNSTGNHSHFEIKKNGEFVDPLGYL